ncbi:MAG TPA: IS481 family transposase [Candidatus Limnocylindria bacterium]|jgi:transposase InsO family protein
MRAFLVVESDRIGVSRTARQLGVSRRTIYRWRHRAPDFADRPCRPHRSPQRSTDAIESAVLAIRLEQRWGPDRIGPVLGLPVSTVHRILRRHGAHRLSHLFPKPPRSFGRFPALAPGELIALDIKSLGRLDRGGGKREYVHSSQAGPLALVGWRHLHVAIDLASRFVHVELRDSVGNADTLPFLEHALAAFDAKGIRVRRVLTDNGAGYKRTFHEHAALLGIRHTRTKPYHPWTNGRVERFNRTIQNECLYSQTLHTEAERDLAVALFVAYYNRQRPHIALGGLAPLDWLDRWRVTQVYGDLS